MSEEVLAQLERNKVELEAMKKGQEETQEVVRQLRALMTAFIAAPLITSTPPPPTLPNTEGGTDEPKIPETPVKRELFPSDIPPLPSPLIASQRNVSMATSKRQEQ